MSKAWEKSSAKISSRDRETADEVDHEAWATAKIEAALRDAKAHPENRVPQDQVWKKFGLER